MRRRAFITLLGGAAAWPLAARAQQSERMRRVGVLSGGPNDAIFRARLTAFEQALQQMGWVEGRNVEFNVRWGGNDAERIVAESRELVRGRPDVILVGPTNALIPLRKETDKIPIVFVQVSDPVGQGIVESLARPSGNLTGFSNLEFSLVGKWLQTLKEIAPAVTRVALLIQTSNAVSASWYRQFDALAPSFAVEPIAATYSGRAEIEPLIEALGRGPKGALICPGDSFTDSPPIRSHIIRLTAFHRVPALHSQREFVTNGGLMSYGVDQIEQFRLAATYVDRILKGEPPANLPIQQPTKFNLAINLKTAKALGLDVPPTLLASADEVIE
jgi:putative ABC transport system substrate-binding protein